MPPCLWGDAAQGLEAPPRIDGRTLQIVKRANATAGHHGEMAHSQVFYAPAKCAGPPPAHEDKG